MALALVPGGLAGQAEPDSSPLPPEGSYGLSFRLPDGGGAGFGFRTMLSPTLNAGVQLDVSYSRRERTDGDTGDTTSSAWGVAVRPDVRLYRWYTGPVVPFIEVGGTFGYSEGERGSWRWEAGGRLGLGVEWFPLESMSISGSTGIDGGYSHSQRPGRANREIRFGAFRSELLLNLYL